VSAECSAVADGWRVVAVMRVPDAPLWWPHTHGAQPLFDSFLTVRTGDEDHTFACGRVSFRRVEVPSGVEPFAIHVNGVPVYCRGACWTVSDLLSPGTVKSLEKDLLLARAAGVNMLRVVGTMVYESDEFYRRCDELGILVWQDFMFANMDYPGDDPIFAANIAEEARYQLDRLAGHPSVVVYCGNSEVEQQAAMVGMPRELWRNRWFAETLPALCAASHPGTVYVPSSPSGGVMPFHVGTGVTHYYAVGAYQRSPAELRQADVKFAAECLAFAQLPEPETVAAVAGTATPMVHHPRWKRRVPRDVGAGWDFEDIRDFYLHWLFDVDPAQLRSFNPPRYLELSRVVGGEMMAQVFAEWRSSRSNNGGGLVLCFKDLWPAPGWGIVDSRGVPKAAYYYLRRSWQSRQVTLTDEGLDGFQVHIINDTPEPFSGYVELLLLREPCTTVARREVPCRLRPRGRQTLQSDDLLGGFFDLGYAYRFGPLAHDVVIATLWDEKHRVVSEAVRFVRRREPVRLRSAMVQAEAVRASDARYVVKLESDCFLHAVRLDVPGFMPEDNYFHLMPARPRTVTFTSIDGAPRPLTGHVEALNLAAPVKIASDLHPHSEAIGYRKKPSAIAGF
jgi:beta-mannosidase